MKKKPKLIAILGPTASGKSDLAVTLAQKFNGEVISADSRQVYRGLDIGTGKITEREMKGVPHHLLDVASPKKIFSVAQYKRKADKTIADIVKRGKLPILCGGTGFYIQAVTEGLLLPDVKPNIALRKQLHTMSTAELFSVLAEKDSERAKAIDAQNPHRLIRAIEIAEALGKVPTLHKETPYETLFIGIAIPPTDLKERIHTRLVKRLRAGMVGEAQKLHAQGLSWKRMEELGLEYRFLARYLQKKLSKKEMLIELEKEIFAYAKRQMTWFKRNKTIHWITPNENALPELPLHVLKKFLG